jgi:hypothetical protein
MMSSLAGSETRNLFNWFRAGLQVEVNEVELNEVELNEVEFERRAAGAGTVRHGHGATRARCDTGMARH